jgi:hypothetical protein
MCGAVVLCIYGMTHVCLQKKNMQTRKKRVAKTGAKTGDLGTNTYIVASYDKLIETVKSKGESRGSPAKKTRHVGV